MIKIDNILNIEDFLKRVKEEKDNQPNEEFLEIEVKRRRFLDDYLLHKIKGQLNLINILRDDVNITAKSKNMIPHMNVGDIKFSRIYLPEVGYINIID